MKEAVQGGSLEVYKPRRGGRRWRIDDRYRQIPVETLDCGFACGLQRPGKYCTGAVRESDGGAWRGQARSTSGRRWSTASPAARTAHAHAQGLGVGRKQGKSGVG